MSSNELKNALTCPVCLDLCKDAMFLPECGHTLCSACIVLIGHQHAEETDSDLIKIPCPECRSESSLSRDNLTRPNFKKNYFVDRAVEILSKDSIKQEDIKRVGEFCPHVQSNDKKAVVCHHCDKSFCKFCIPTHADLVKAEIGWAAIDFKHEIEQVSKPFDEQKLRLKSDLKENADKARQAVVTSCKDLITNVTKLLESKCDSLLAIIDKRQQELDETIDNSELPTEIKPQNIATWHTEFLRKFKVLEGESMLFSTLGQVSDVFQVARTIDCSLREAMMFYSKMQSLTSAKFHCESERMLDLLSKALDADIKLSVGDSSAIDRTLKLENADLLTKTRLFHDLAKSGNLSEIKRILEDCNLKSTYRRFIVDHRDSSDHQRTAVMQASFHGHLELVRYLVQQHSADVNIPDSNGDSPVAIACRSSNMDVVFALTDRDNINDSLIAIAEAGHSETLKMLLEQHFLNSNSKQKGQIFFESTCVVELAAALGLTQLLESINKTNLFEIGERLGSGRFALHVAACFGQTETVKYLAHEFPKQIDLCDSDGFTPFLVAVQFDQDEVVKYLLETYPQVGGNVAKRSAINALLIACSNGNLELLIYLISKGFSCFKSDVNDRAPLNYAACFGRLNVVKFLIDHYRTSKHNHKLDWMLSRDDIGREPTHDAAFQGHLNVLEYLLKSQNRHHVTSTDDEGNNLLHYAVKNVSPVLGDRFEVVAYLMEHWPEMADQTNNDYQTPIDVARSNDEEDDVIEIMENP